MRDLERWWEKWKVKFILVSECEKVIQKLSIYRPKRGINLKTINESNQCSNWLD